MISPDYEYKFSIILLLYSMYNSEKTFIEAKQDANDDEIWSSRVACIEGKHGN